MTKSWGPFSGRQLTIIICVVSVTVLFPVGAWAVAGNNVFVTDAATGNHATVDGSGNLHTVVANPNAIPQNQFSVSPLQIFAGFAGSPAMQPDPSGTRYAISSFTVTNPGASAITVLLGAISAQTFSHGCSIIANSVKVSGGPEVVVGANSTVSLPFPQPYVFGTTGAKQCLVAASANAGPDATWSAVGRKI